MADPQLVTQEEMALRRRARRRLVGAVAIALAAVVLLPMLFDPEPKPLGADVDLRIPSKDSPFEAAPAAAPEPPPQVAEPTLPPVLAAPGPAVDPGKDSPAPQVKPPEPAAAASPAALPETPSRAEAGPKPKSESSAVEKTEPKTEPKPQAKPKPVAKSETVAKSESVAKSGPVQGNKGYVLQLGAFGSEANARQLLDKAQAAGFKASISAANGQFRVRVGPMPEHDKALETQSRLKAKGFNPVLMGP